tara:strand:- start:317 stop:604 length:288 start_codon:yes stop_codon:yes gene_type:complete
MRKGIVTPITPGIMPITGKDSLIKMSKSCGAKLPKNLISKLSEFDDDEDLKKFGIDFVAGLCEELLDNNAPGLHFYTINQIEPTKQIVDLLNLGA